MSVTIELPLELSEHEIDEVKHDLAVGLYQRRVVGLGKTAKVAGLTQIEFQRLLAGRRVPLHYDEADLEADLATHAEVQTRNG